MRRLLLALPAVAVGIVLWAVLSAGWARPVEVARVVGGPTLGSANASWLLSVEQLDEGRRTPSPDRPLRLQLQAGALRADWLGSSDRSGHAEVRIELARPLDVNPWIRIERSDTGAVLAEGTLALSVEKWRTGAQRRGGWLPGQQQGELWLRVAPAQGTLAVPFASELVLELTRGPATAPAPGGLVFGAQPVAGATLELELSGAEGSSNAAPRTGADGRALVGIRPLEHAIVLHARAHAPDGPNAEWYGALPVTPGALLATLEGTRLLMRSPIPREHAYVSLVSADQRLAGYSLELSTNADGGADASVELEPALLERLASEPTFAVVSSEPDKRSLGSVGWPLHADGAGPNLSFDVADQLLLDGSEGVLEREASARRGRRRVAALLLGLVGSAMLSGFAQQIRQRPRPAGEASAGADALALASQRGWLGLALGCLLLGIAALAYFGLLQR
jgi:hypothetical protein